jgi:hypothetical protein
MSINNYKDCPSNFLTKEKMQLINVLLFPALLLQATHAIAIPRGPDIEPRQGDRGSYTVSGLGSRKQALFGAGGNTLDLAIAMLETERLSTDYSYGVLL